jgi:hypothetical protein
MSRAEQYQLLGVNSEEQLALGIDVDDVLEYIGTRSDLMNKFMTDLPHLGPTTTATAATTTTDNGSSSSSSSSNANNSVVEQEVNKFLLDGEMLDIMIKYEQRKREDPTWEPEQQYATGKGESSPINAVINFVAQYGVYVVGAILVKDVVEVIINKYNAGGG